MYLMGRGAVKVKKARMIPRTLGLPEKYYTNIKH